MAEVITAEHMAALLDDWAAQSDPFVGNMQTDFGLSEAQRTDPVVKAAATFANFRFEVSLAPQSPAGPFLMAMQDSWQTLQYIRDEHPEVLAIWHDLTLLTEHRLVKAMLNDLLWLLGYEERQKTHVYARAAIAFYQEYFDELPKLQVEDRELRQHDLLRRAAELTKAIKAEEEYRDIAKRCEAMFGEAPGEDSFWAIRASACLPAQYRPSSVADRIESLHDSYAARTDDETLPLSEFLYDVQLEMAKKDGDKEGVKKIRGNACRLMIDKARDLGSDIRSAAFLQEAEKWAKGAEGESLLIAEIREIRGDLAYDGEFHEITSDLPVPTDVILRATTAVRAAESVVAALDLVHECGRQWLADIDAVEEAANQAYDQAVILQLVSQVHIVHDNIECCRPHSDREKRGRRVAEHFRLQALMAASVMIGPCLTEAVERSDVSPNVICEYMLAGIAISEVEANAFARAFDFYREEDCDAAVHVALPRIESSLRMLARMAGISISYPPQGEKCGGLEGLWGILDDLAEFIGAPASRMLRYLLVDNHGMNLRDNYAHGVPAEDPRADAALVLWIALWLANLRPVEETVTNTAE